MLLIAALPSASGREAVSLDVFYDNLDPYGSWIETDDYGYVWHPRDVDEGWRPYSDGRWVYTDAGWTWDSDEPYGWAVYHYGRWANLDQVGWVWVPGTEWGPAWVSWRHSPKYVGWAPLPPEAEFRQDTGFSEWVDDYYDIGPSNYRFVEVRNLGALRLRTVFVNQSENISIIQQTTNITNITYQNNIVFNGGIGYDEVSRFSTEPIRRLRLDRREQFDGDLRHMPADGFRARIEGNSLSVMALPFVHSSAAPRKVGERIGRVEINHGWRNAGPAEQVASVRAKFKSEAKVPASLPPQPRFERKAGPAGNADARRPGERERDNRTRGEENVRKPGEPPVASERKPESKETPGAMPGGNRRDRGRNPAAPPEEVTGARDGEGKGKMKDAPRPGPAETPERGGIRKPGPRSVEQPGPAPKPAEPPAREPRKVESDPPKPRLPEQPKRPETEPTKPRPPVPQPKEPKHPDAEPMPGKSRPAEPEAREPKRAAPERPSARPEGSPNNNSQQERGRGKPGDNDKKKPE